MIPPVPEGEVGKAAGNLVTQHARESTGSSDRDRPAGSMVGGECGLTSFGLEPQSLFHLASDRIPLFSFLRIPI